MSARREEMTRLRDLLPVNTRLLLNCGSQYVPTLYEATIIEWSPDAYVRLELYDGSRSWRPTLDPVVEVLPAQETRS